jgi:hypothetical protein
MARKSKNQSGQPKASRRVFQELDVNVACIPNYELDELLKGECTVRNRLPDYDDELYDDFGCG